MSDDVKAFLGDVQAVAAVDDPRDATVWKLQELSNADKPRVLSIAVPSLYQTDPLTMKTRYSRVSFEVNELAH